MNDTLHDVARWADRGEIDVWVQAYEPGPFEDAARSGARAAEVTPLAGPRAGAKLVITPDGGRFGSLGSAEADAEAASVASELLWTDVSTRRGSLFIDVVGPAPRLLLVGAVDIAGTLCTLAKAMGWRPYVIDPRARFATSAVQATRATARRGSRRRRT
jgi:xanthine dehydrogenase accessory factor